MGVSSLGWTWSGIFRDSRSISSRELLSRLKIHIQPAETASMDEERRIPPFAEDTLTPLTDAAGGTGEALPRDEAIDAITDVERFNKADAEDALAQLESRGYIYFVDEQESQAQLNSTGMRGDFQQ